MAVVVTDKCYGCRFTDCVAICPVECFHADENMIYIDPEECIECMACVPVCPVEAICEDVELPDDKTEWITINAQRSQRLPLVIGKLAPLPDREERKAALGY